MRAGQTPRFDGLSPASGKSSGAAKGCSLKTDTRPEVILRRALWKRGLRYRKNWRSLPGRPDIVLLGVRVAIFVDGDFWHGRDWAKLKEKLSGGHNGEYWVSKIERNRARDRVQEYALRKEGWMVLRVWETDVHRALDQVVCLVEDTVARRRAGKVC